MSSTSPRTAYILQMHNNPEQVNKFIKQLIAEGGADVYVHIDKKSYEKLNGKIIKSPNVKVLQQCVNCEWGDISQVDATLLLLKEVLATDIHYDYICLRSGQDLLIKNGFKDFLIENSGSLFFAHRMLEEGNLGYVKLKWPKATRRRFTSAHPLRIYRRLMQGLFQKGINLFPNTQYWPEEFQFYKGSQWFTIPYEAGKYIVKFLNDNDWYYRFFENTLVPDESFFHTLIMNSPYKEKVVNDNLFYMKWGETLKDRNSPQYLRIDDVPLIESSNQYFARKFDENIDKSVVDYFAEKIVFDRNKITNRG